MFAAPRDRLKEYEESLKGKKQAARPAGDPDLDDVLKSAPKSRDANALPAMISGSSTARSLRLHYQAGR